MPGELEPGEHPIAWDVGELLGEKLVCRIETIAVYFDAYGLRASSVGAARYQLVELLAGVHANVDRELSRVRFLVIGLRPETPSMLRSRNLSGILSRLHRPPRV